MLPRSKQKEWLQSFHFSQKENLTPRFCLIVSQFGHRIQLLRRLQNMNLEILGESKSDIGSTIASASPGILIQIGHSNASLPSSIFAERIVVDDRPAAGGGLPDFWEATIAHLISYVERNPNISAVYVLGNLAHGKETASKLRQIGSWGRRWWTNGFQDRHVSHQHPKSFFSSERKDFLPQKWERARCSPGQACATPTNITSGQPTVFRGQKTTAVSGANVPTDKHAFKRGRLESEHGGSCLSTCASDSQAIRRGGR